MFDHFPRTPNNQRYEHLQFTPAFMLELKFVQIISTFFSKVKGSDGIHVQWGLQLIFEIYRKTITQGYTDSNID